MIEPNGNAAIVKCPECGKVLRIIQRFSSMAELRRIDASMLERHECQPKA